MQHYIYRISALFIANAISITKTITCPSDPHLVDMYVRELILFLAMAPNKSLTFHDPCGFPISKPIQREETL